MSLLNSVFFACACLFAYNLGFATLASTQADCPFTRRLLQDTNEDNAFGDLADAASVFQEVDRNLCCCFAGLLHSDADVDRIV